MANLKEDVTNVTWNAVEGIASIFGLGSLVANFAKSVGYVSDTATVTKAINKLIQSGKFKSQEELDRMIAKLNEIPQAKSAIQASVYQKYKEDLRNDIYKKQRQIGEAETLANQALSRAANIDYLTTGEKNRAQETALQEASQAAKLYEKEI